LWWDSHELAAKRKEQEREGKMYRLVVVKSDTTKDGGRLYEEE
jgi:hypothetical protein